MGCGESRTLSNKPAKSVVTQDTYIDDYDDDLSIDHVDKSTKQSAIANGQVKNNNLKSSSKTSSNGHVIKQDNKSLEPKTNQSIMFISSDKNSYGVKKTAKQTKPNTENITNVVDIEEYGTSNYEVDISNNNNDVKEIMTKSTTNMNAKTSNEQSYTGNTGASKQSQEQTLIVLSKSSKPANGVTRTSKPVSSNAKNVMNVVDLEDYD